MVAQSRLEPMNASPHHAKVRVSLKLANSLFVAGGNITGKIELECKADKGMGIGVIMVELFAVEELTARDHSGTSTFLHVKRFFQGPGLPPSNAVHPPTVVGDSALPAHYYPARRGTTTFLFKLPLPESSPSAINFASGLAQVRYEIRATVGVAWRGENKLVFDKKAVDVVETLQTNASRTDPEAVVVSENGKIWVHGRLAGGVMVAGQPACIELQVKNHSTKKNTGLSLSLARELVIPMRSDPQKRPLQISDTLTTVSFNGPEYIIHPGAEGVALLVFDLPEHARSVHGRSREGDEEGSRHVDPLFEVRCLVNVKLSMGIISKDILLSIPAPILHPTAASSLPLQEQPKPAVHAMPIYDHMSPMPYASYAPSSPRVGRPLSPYPYSPPISPPPDPYTGYDQAWPPPLIPASPLYHAFSPPPMSPPLPYQYYYYNPMPHSLVTPYAPPPRPSSTEPVPSQPFHGLPPPLPPVPLQQPLSLLHGSSSYVAQREEGKGERASRISLHLRMSSRHRSVSPPAHRYSIPAASEPEPHALQHLTPPSAAIPIPGALTSPYTKGSPVSSAGTRHLSPSMPTSPVRSQGSVRSPRPILSPKHSFSDDPSMHGTQVEQLERIAAEVDDENADMSSGALHLELGKRDQALPRVPDPSQKPKLLSARAAVDTIFSSDGLDETPPTPTLAAVTSLKVTRATAHGGPSGLDALEAKLLAEVGTRKVERSNGHADVRSVMPIAIPRPADADPALESAISSLTLPGLDAEARTPRIGPPDEIDHLKIGQEEEDDDYALTERRRWKGSDPGSHETRKDGSSIGTKKSKDKERPGRKKSFETASTGKGKEIRQLKITAQGRVAAWLGSIEPDVPPPSSTPPPVSPSPDIGDQKDVFRVNAKDRVAAWLGNLRTEVPQPSDLTPPAGPRAPIYKYIDDVTRGTEDDKPILSVQDASQEKLDETVEPNVSAAPNPRSSGFMPIGTLRSENSQVRGDSKRLTAAQIDRHHRKVMKAPVISPRLTVYPPRPVDPEVRYDIRSARGGRGGKVTKVASLWASASQQNEKGTSSPQSPAAKNVLPKVKRPANGDATPRNPRSPRSPNKANAASTPGGRKTPVKDAKRAMMMKSSSVPAAVSSSLAVPMLSSMASLARPVSPPNDRVKANISLAAVSEQTVPVIAAAKRPVSPKGELAFGQARLRELIKRYQGQAPT
ncbi:uncharacterized protein LAESUDRAFT_762682 [Laetiporus sulphureus 93-53]|uniref:Arrestin-like N-terminal domain-containing protein n=1 Tax=Laetiporus sulphureus 93-53 TaxID=1314785 RepID=A0A165CC77_9APHY|nr:uncharacterized protein LAESUDRAFT_762682 [Laetiporus sulphureus 93-53]KZT02549.1 hypothetical protein LAESUDRAFT_762682 [Laetiporus sulphureus 93-53]